MEARSRNEAGEEILECRAEELQHILESDAPSDCYLSCRRWTDGTVQDLYCGVVYVRHGEVGSW